MPTIVDRSTSVALLRREFAALATLCSDLTEDQWHRATCLPGWTVQDVLSHVIGAEAMLLGEPAPTADTTHLDHMRNPIAEANEMWVESMRPLSGEAMLARLADVTGRRLAELDGMTQADFDAPSWTPAGKDETYGRFMRIRHYDCFMHEHDIRDALGEPARLDSATSWDGGPRCRPGHGCSSTSPVREPVPIWSKWTTAPGWWTTSMTDRPWDWRCPSRCFSA
jgi:uncharacterized protein (TIGR03083 family)